MSWLVEPNACILPSDASGFSNEGRMCQVEIPIHVRIQIDGCISTIFAHQYDQPKRTDPNLLKQMVPKVIQLSI